MAYKQLGGTDRTVGGRLGRFICYCPHCDKKVVMTREQMEYIARYSGCGKVFHLNIKSHIKKGLTDLADRL